MYKFNSVKTILILSLVLFTSVGIGILTVDSKEEPVNDIWIPTEEDIQYQDSMWSIIEDTRRSVDTIRDVMDNIIWKLDRGRRRGVRRPENMSTLDFLFPSCFNRESE